MFTSDMLSVRFARCSLPTIHARGFGRKSCKREVAERPALELRTYSASLCPECCALSNLLRWRPLYPILHTLSSSRNSRSALMLRSRTRDFGIGSAANSAGVRECIACSPVTEIRHAAVCAVAACRFELDLLSAENFPQTRARHSIADFGGPTAGRAVFAKSGFAYQPPEPGRARGQKCRPG